MNSVFNQTWQKIDKIYQCAVYGETLLMSIAQCNEWIA